MITMSDPRNDLVLGAFVRYQWDELASYILSLKATGYKGKIVLLYDLASDETLKKLAAHGVECHRLGYPRRSDLWNSWGRFWRYTRPLILRMPTPHLRYWLQARLMGMVWFRYYAAWAFLKNRCHLYRNVIWSDVRDVVFQGNPSDLEVLDGVQAAKERTDLKFKLCPYCGPWMHTVLGSAIAGQFAELTPSCCGAVMGDSGSMVEYFRRFLALSLEVEAVSHGGDTAIHNQIVYHPGQEKTVLHEYREGPILHLCTNDIRRDHRGFLVDKSGRPFTLIHFFNRFPEVFFQHPLLGNIVGQFINEQTK